MRANWNMPKFISTSIDIGTITDSISPVGLSWYLANEDDQLTPGIPIDTVLVCAECDGVDYTCSNSGVCNNETKTCNCTNGFKGPKCDRRYSVIIRRLPRKYEDKNESRKYPTQLC